MSEIQGSIRRLISAPIMDIDPLNPHNDRNHTQNYILEAVNAEKQLWKLIHSKGLLHIGVQELYRKTRCTYEKIILNDHELAELQDIEYSLWKLHYKHIDEYRNRIRGSSATKEHINLATVQHVATMHHKTENYLEGFNSFLSEATEFYHHLIKKIRRSFGLSEELLFFNEGGFSSSMDSTRMHRCQFSCHRCLVCLGDLARYRELYGNPDGQIRIWSVAATHYLNASKIWPDSGNPHNQLAVLAIYVGDELLALYHCIRSIAVKEPFPNAWDNLILLFEKNRSCHLTSLSNLATFNFFKPSERSTVQVKAQSSDSFSNCQLREATGDDLTEGTELWSLIVRMMSYFYVKPSLEDFPCIFGSTIRELEALLLLDDTRLMIAMESYEHMDVVRTGPFRVLQLVSVFIFTIHTLSERSKPEKAKHGEYMQQPSLIQLAFTTAFIFMGRLVNRCMIADPMGCSPLLPAILVFVEWLVDILDSVEKYATDEKCASAIGYFFNAFVNLLNQFDDEGSEIHSPDFSNLWEDNEFRGFLPISKTHGPLDLKSHQETSNGSADRNESQVRIGRIFVAAMKIVNKSIGPQKWIFHEKTGRKFYTAESKKLPDRREQLVTGLDPKVRELPQHFQMSKNALPVEEVTEACEVAPNEDDGKELDVHKSAPLEEEEVILFNPMTRHNSAPLYLPLRTNFQVPKEGDSSLAASSCEYSYHGFPSHLPEKEICIEPIPEDSVMDSFIELTDSPMFGALNAKSDEPPSLAGPPSLSAWVVNQGTYGIVGGNVLKEASKHRSGRTEDIASEHLTGLSIGGNEANQQEVKITSAPASNLKYGSTYEGDPVIGHRNLSPNSHHQSSPYIAPLPSAPLLPDDAMWFTGNSSNYAEHKKLEDVKGFFPVAAQVNSYSKSTGTRGPPNFNLNIPTFTDRHEPYCGQTSSAQRLNQYQVNLDRTHDHILPVHFYTPTTLGRFQDNDVCRVPPRDQSTISLALHPMKHLENPPFYPSFISGVDEQKKERLFPAFPGPRPCDYGVVKDLRSEQQLLLKYLKEKEWHLKQESQLRGSA